MKKYSVAVIGCGGRGSGFVEVMQGMGEKYEVVSLCDINIKQIEKIHKRFGLEDTEDFVDAEGFFEKKRADVLIIATADRFHVPQAVRALKLGYDILLEKPISDDRKELELLYNTQKNTGKKVVVCHELRYGRGYRKCAELIDSGIIGRLYAIDASERVGYWHWAQAYVRGIGASIKDGHPAILAKCSHDLDLLQSYAKSKCDTISSVGELCFFKPENAPVDSAERCVECKYADTCAYSAKRIYIDAWHKNGEPEFSWPYNKASIIYPNTEENLLDGIKNGEYGQCVYKCKVDKVDHQFVQMTFKNGIKASLKMVFAAYPGRRISFYGTFGEIVFDERADYIEVMPFGEEKKIIDVNCGQGHGGGDYVLIEELYDIIRGTQKCATDLEDSIECHLMGISAEESRKCGGELVRVHK